jgi:hypothetical protein
MGTEPGMRLPGIAVRQNLGAPFKRGLLHV